MHTYSFNRISEFKDGSITGPMSPILGAGEVAKQMNETLIGVLRVELKTLHKHSEYPEYDQRMYQIHEKGEGWTGYDHLILIFLGWVVFIVDQGTSSALVAACFGTGADDVDIKIRQRFDMELPDDILTAMMYEAYKAGQDYLNGEFKQQYQAFKKAS
jgi:hypothetical protein